MANANSPFGIRFLKGLHGSFTELEPVTLASNVGVLPGDPIRLSGGLGVACTTSQAPWGFATQTITAIAATQQQVLVEPAAFGSVFITQLLGTTAWSQAHIGKKGFLGGNSGVKGITASTLVASGTLTNAPYLIRRRYVKEGNAALTYALVEISVVRSQFTGHLDAA